MCRCHWRPRGKWRKASWCRLVANEAGAGYGRSCTKWARADRFSDPYHDWQFEFDHIFVTSNIVARAPAAFLPYRYPGTAQPCADDACTGEAPPGNVTSAHQGSWHRGLLVELEV